MNPIAATHQMDINGVNKPPNPAIENIQGGDPPPDKHWESQKTVEKNTTLNKSDLEQIAKTVEDLAPERDWDMKIVNDEKTKQMIVQIVSQDNGKVIRQFPPEHLIELAGKMEEIVGVFISETI